VGYDFDIILILFIASVFDIHIFNFGLQAYGIATRQKTSKSDSLGRSFSYTSHALVEASSAVVSKVGGTAPLGVVKQKWAVGKRWETQLTITFLLSYYL